MIAQNPLSLAVMVLGAVLLVAVPESGEAQMLCLDCHDIHNSPGGTLNTAAEFDLICDSCHGPGAPASGPERPAVFADRHIDPTVNIASGNTGKPAWEMGCSTCHTPHYTDVVNRLYKGGKVTDGAIASPSGDTADLESPGSNLPTLAVNDDILVSRFSNAVNNGLYQVTAVNTVNQDYSVVKNDGATLIAESPARIVVSIQHAHVLGGDSGNLVDGINIKLLGRDEDGTGIAKFATPLRISNVDSAGPCTNSNTEVEVFLPPFSFGEGPPAMIMVGDRIVINNGGAEFDGSFRVRETNWDGFLNDPPTGWVCFDRPTTGVYDPTGFVRSMGWYERPYVFRAEWALNTATLNLFGDHSIQVGDTINVTGVTEVNANTFNGLKTVTAVTNTGITAASWSAGTATLTLAENHLYQVGEIIVVTDVISGGPGSFNGRFTITVVNGQDVSYDLVTDPGPYTNSGAIATRQISRVTYAASDPGTNNVSGGNVEYVGSIKSVQNMAVFQAPPLPGEEPYSVQSLTFSAGNRPDRVDTVVLTLERAHVFVIDDTFSVTGIISVGGTTDEFNGTWTITDVPSATEIEFENAWDPNPGAYVSGGVIPHPNTPPPVLEITLTNSDSNINQFKSATSGVRDGDIITVFGVDPDGYNSRWEVESVALPVVTVRCPPYFRTSIPAPACTLNGVPAYVSDGEIQSTGTMRPVVYESRGTDNTDPDFLSDHTHSFANTDEDNDGWMDGPCELCHTQTAHHQNDDLGNTHNNGRTCAGSCHTHSVGFDRNAEFCPNGRTCPPVN